MSLASEIYVREIRDASGDNCWYLELRTNAGPERIRSALTAVGLGGYVQEINWTAPLFLSGSPKDSSVTGESNAGRRKTGLDAFRINAEGFQAGLSRFRMRALRLSGSLLVVLLVL